MAVTLRHYYQAGLWRNDGTIGLLNPAISLALLAKTYTPDLDLHSLWADVSAHEVGDGNGYSSGGQAMTGLSLVRTGPLTTWSADQVTWTALTKTFKYGVIYLAATVNGVVKPLISLVDFNDTSTDAEVSVNGSDGVFEPNPAGLLIVGPDTDICG